jgi:hypothetical protein
VALARLASTTPGSAVGVTPPTCIASVDVLLITSSYGWRHRGRRGCAVLYAGLEASRTPIVEEARRGLSLWCSSLRRLLAPICPSRQLSSSSARPTRWSSPTRVSRLVASVCFKYFSCFRGMLQVYHVNVAKVDQDVACVASVSKAYCNHLFKIFYRFSDVCLQVFFIWMLYVFHTCCKSMFQ